MRKLVMFAMTLVMLEFLSITTGVGTRKVAANAPTAGEFTAHKFRFCSMRLA